MVEGVPYNPNVTADLDELFRRGFEYHNGQWVQVRGDPVNYVEHGGTVFTPDPRTTATADKGSSLTNTLFGTIQTASPGVMINSISGGVWSGFDPNNMESSLAALHAFALSTYGSLELGSVRYSSEVLENEPTGVRPGTMERIVIPAWARRERGSPL